MMTALNPKTSIRVKNVGSDDIPPRSIVVVTGTALTSANSTQEAELYATVKKYAGEDGTFMVTGQATITVNNYGTAFYDQFVYAAVAPSESPIAGAEYGPISGQYYVALGGVGFIAIGHDGNSGNPRMSLFYRSPSTTVPYVVTQVSAGANVAIYRETGLTFNANPSYPSFNAQPLALTSTINLGTVDHSKDETVYSSCLAGPIFTGQVFMCVRGSKRVALGGDNGQFKGTVVSTSGANVLVTISYYSNATVAQTVNLYATNDTGLTLTAGQIVYVTLVNHLNSNTSRFRASEYVCP